MKVIALTLNYDHLMVLDVSKTPALLAEIAAAKVYKVEGWGAERKIIEDPDTKLELQFLDDSELLDKPDALKRAIEDLDRRTKEYYGVITAKSAVEKELKEVRAELDRVKAAVKGDGE